MGTLSFSIFTDPNKSPELENALTATLCNKNQRASLVPHLLRIFKGHNTLLISSP